MTVWLDKDNTSASAVYTVKNTSSALSARLSTSVTNVSGASADYFSDITAVYYADSACTDPLGTDLLPANQKAYLKVTVSMAKAPLADVTNATFSVATTAEPAEAD